MERRTRSALLWAALAVPVVSVDRLGMNEPRPAWQQITSLAVLAAAVAVRRGRPLPAFLAAAALGLVAGSSLFTLSYGPALAVFALLLGRRADRARPALLAFGAVALVGTVKIAVRDVDPVVEWLVLMGTLVFGTVFPWLTGRYWRQGRELAAAGWARADQLEREQRIVADRARLRERARIAQDMHDSLGHELSLIAVRAGALQVAPDLPTPHREAAADLRAAASQATDRLHAIIGLLREADDEPAPLSPTGETVADLIARASESGLRIVYEEEGGGGPAAGVGEAGVAPAAGAGPAAEAAAAEGRVAFVAGAGPATEVAPAAEAAAAEARVAPAAEGVSTTEAAAVEARGVFATEAVPAAGAASETEVASAEAGLAPVAGAAPEVGVAAATDAGPSEGRVEAATKAVPVTEAVSPTGAVPATQATPAEAKPAAPTDAAPTDRTVHRVVQEALTNAAKHAPGAHVTVTVARGRDATTVTVTNGRPQEPASASEGGSGLRGLRARVTDLGGTFDAGPHGDGFRVTARVPAEGSAPAPPRFGAHLAYARRRTVLAFGGAVATGALLVGGTFAWYAYSRTHSVLDPADYARLRVGTPRAEAARVLPDRAAADPPVERAPTPPPKGAECAYYRASGELFTAVPYFRICFGGESRNRLVDKAVIPTAGEMEKERAR
ncbi:histidine kinase [Streptomyces sp. NPDC018059]|uniref:histidine kinase n=1 Tax=Streptomyces sp. NPDC018059 TaxID=3365041 RepID=UPI0037B06A9B